MKAFALHDLPFLARGARGTARDNMENYTSLALVNGLTNGFFEWAGVLPYVARTSAYGVYVFDNLESYANASAVDSLNGGSVDWTGAYPYVGREGYTGLKGTDNFESYSNGASLNTLNGGSGWSGAWIGR